MAYIDTFLSQKVHDKSHVKIFLTNGVCLRGFIDEYDDECLVLTNDVLIMRNAIATVQDDDSYKK